jgi:hypothetical protein
VIVGSALVLLAPGLGGAEESPPFVTDEQTMLEPVLGGAETQPIISVGDELTNGYEFQSVPDGISLLGGEGRAQALVNHETTTVPFPFIEGSPEESFSDFRNAELSRLRLVDSGGEVAVSGAHLAIRSSSNYQRFCSNYLATEAEDFERDLLLTNEETPDYVFRSGRAWRGPDTASDPEAEQAGVVVAYDPDTREHRTIYGMGRHNHENSLAVPGYGHPVVLSGDDTFSAPSSQLYLYQAGSAREVWKDDGHLWAFKSSQANDYGDLQGTDDVSGRFIRVPDRVARGGQDGLEAWSNDHNVFQFIRIEDLAYDRNQSNVVYFADTGEPRAVPDPDTTRLMRGPEGTEGPYPNGRIFRLELSPSDPLRVRSLSILIDGDARGAAGAGDLDLIHQPDNVETTADGLLFQEDPGSHNQYLSGTGTTARIWRYSLADRSLQVVARVDQALDPEADSGEWESSGIVDASAHFGEGAFLVTVQAHSLWLETAPGPDVTGDGEPDWTLKREAGQLLLLRLPPE